MHHLVTVSFVAIALLGCEPPGSEGGVLLRTGLTVQNGNALNGNALNGRDLSHTLISVSFAGAMRGSAPGDRLDSTWLVGTELWGNQATSTFRGLDFDQARFAGTSGDGRPVDVSIAGVRPPDAGDDVWHYLVRYYDPQDAAWYPVCVRDDGTPLEAIPVEGRWNYQFGTEGGGAKISDGTVFTFACEEAAIAKCIHMGYKPWATAADGTSLAAHHQACTRMVRADYCGDGTSYTVDGQWVNVYDAAGVQADTEDWLFEAEWDEGGARCFSPHNRYHANVPCHRERTESRCGQLEHFASGTLLMTETPYRN